MLKRDVAADWRKRRTPRGKLRLGRRVQNIAQPLDRNPRLVKILPELRKPKQARG